MTNEIKEIREYIACPQFGDDHDVIVCQNLLNILQGENNES